MRLDDHHDEIRELYHQGFVYRLIAFILRERHGEEVAELSVAKYCRRQDWHTDRHPQSGYADVLERADPDEFPGGSDRPPPGDETWRRYYDADADGDAESAESAQDGADDDET